MAKRKSRMPATCRSAEFLRDHGMVVWPFCGRIACVRDSTIAPPKGPRASEQGILRPWFFLTKPPAPGQENAVFFKIHEFPLAVLEISGHLFVTANEFFTSVNHPFACHFQIPDERGISPVDFPGGDSMWCRTHSEFFGGNVHQ